MQTALNKIDWRVLIAPIYIYLFVLTGSAGEDMQGWFDLLAWSGAGYFFFVAVAVMSGERPFIKQAFELTGLWQISKHVSDYWLVYATILIGSVLYIQATS